MEHIYKAADVAEQRLMVAQTFLRSLLADYARNNGFPYEGSGDFNDVLAHRGWLVSTSSSNEEDTEGKASYIPLRTMRMIFTLMTFGYGHEGVTETTMRTTGNGPLDQVVEVKATISDGFGNEYFGTVVRTFDQSSFASAGQKAAKLLNLARGSAYSAAYASALANLGLFPIYKETPKETTTAPNATPAPKARPAAPVKEMTADMPSIPANTSVSQPSKTVSDAEFAAMVEAVEELNPKKKAKETKAKKPSAKAAVKEQDEAATVSEMSLSEALNYKCSLAPGYTIGQIVGLEKCANQKPMRSGTENALKLPALYQDSSASPEEKKAAEIVLNHMAEDDAAFAAKLNDIRNALNSGKEVGSN